MTQGEVTFFGLAPLKEKRLLLPGKEKKINVALVHLPRKWSFASCDGFLHPSSALVIFSGADNHFCLWVTLYRVYNPARSGLLLKDFLKSSCNRFFILVLKIRRNSEKAPCCISNLLMASHITLATWSLIDTTFCFILCTKYNMPAILGCQDSPFYKARAFQKSWSR